MELLSKVLPNKIHNECVFILHVVLVGWTSCTSFVGNLQVEEMTVCKISHIRKKP